jgi:hypothetical protein
LVKGENMNETIKKLVPQNFNDLLALFVVMLIVAYVIITSVFNFDNKVVDLAVGVFLAKFSDIIQYYFRKSKTEL